MDASDNSFTLHGWPTRKPFIGGGLKFDTDDADIIPLIKGDLSDVTFSDKMYLSPPFLDKDIIKQINSSNSKYVYFYPHVYRSNTYGELIKYTVHFSNITPVLQPASSGDTTYSMQVMTLYYNQYSVDINPSPPKQDF
jgi:hypothetical protein